MSETQARAASAAVEERKARLREAFASWLEELMAEEAPPAGMAAELLAELEGGAAAESAAEGDLYALWSAVTALTQEVRLEGRAFRQLQDVLSPLAGRQEQVMAAHEEALAAARGIAAQALAGRTEREQEAQRAARAEGLEALLDTRDRLSRAMQSARPLLAAARQALTAPRLFGLVRPHPTAERTLEAVTALEDGCRLALARLDEVLGRLGVVEMDCAGRPFDPARMAAVEVVDAGGAEEGTVLEIYRTGYECAGRVVRAAQVKVARAPARTA